MKERAGVSVGIAYSRADPNKGYPSTSAVAFIREALTGARPLLLVCDDGQTYWAKGPGNPHGNLTLVHEWFISELSRTMGGPLPRGVLIEVDGSLLEGQNIDGQARESGTWFGSQLLQGEEHTALQLAQRDGNPERIPFYLALWHLCLGIDAQFIFERSADDRVWSIDHGLWFSNADGDWTDLGGLDVFCSMTWDDPEWSGSQSISPEALLKAADAIENLHAEVLGEIAGSVPVDWGVRDEDLEHLALFIHKRRELVSGQLRARAGRT